MQKAIEAVIERSIKKYREWYKFKVLRSNHYVLFIKDSMNITIIERENILNQTNTYKIQLKLGEMLLYEYFTNYVNVKNFSILDITNILEKYNGGHN